MCEHNIVLSVGLVVCFVCGVAAQPSSEIHESRALESGNTIERRIAGGEVHSYEITLEAGQVLRAVVDSRDIHVSVTIKGPTGQSLLEADNLADADGPEFISLPAEVSGTYRLEVRPSEGAGPGRYDVKMLELLTRAEYCARLTDDRAAAGAANDWLISHAIRLTTAEVGHGFADMQPLKEIVGRARIVSLGESTHGTREFYQLTHRMLEFLVTEMGFNVFAIEASMPESFDINEYILTGKGSPAKALAGLYSWTWDNYEAMQIILWMRQYNADPMHSRKVMFYGFDMQWPARAAKVTLAYLHKVDSPQARMAEKELGRFTNPYTSRNRVVEDKKGAEAIRLVQSDLDGRKDEYIQRTSMGEWTLARQHARILGQNIEMMNQAFSVAALCPVRDRSMAENIRWIVEHEGPEAKVVILAHSDHVATANQDGIESMGSHLRRMFGSDMIVFGLVFNQGEFEAMEIEDSFPFGRRLRTFRVGPAAAESLEAMFASTGLQRAMIDLRSLPQTGKVANWFRTPRPARRVGLRYREDQSPRYLTGAVAPQLYDALLFVENTLAIRPFVADLYPELRQKLPGPANMDFENGDSGKPPVEWCVPPDLDRFDYEVVTSEEHPYSGKRSAMISRLPGAHYGETVGFFAQRLDATPYRGGKIRLKAAARSELMGKYDLSWLNLSISIGLGPRVAPYDLPRSRWVESPDWCMYEVVAEVPENASAVLYGLFLWGEGKAWLDSVSVEVIPPGSPVENSWDDFEERPSLEEMQERFRRVFGEN